MLSRLWRREDPYEEPARALYDGVVQAARRPVFYAEMGVADTLDGRFDMIALHAALVMRRLNWLGPDGAELAQALFDVLFADMDQSLREIGVGDLGVGPRIRKMATAFYGRVAIYDAALKVGDRPALAEALARNVYRVESADAAPEALERMTSYVTALSDALAKTSKARMMAGEANFEVAP